MTGKVLEVQALNDRDWLAKQIAVNYENWASQMRGKRDEWRELRNYLFATSTQDTTNALLPWKNTTVTPKLTQIRDNLHANYMDALFPNDRWFKWEGSDASAEIASKREAIESYMRNKTQINDFRNIISKLLYDYIDYGNCYADVEYVHEKIEDPDTGEVISGFVGPKAIRISPLDIVFNITASEFVESPKITRLIKTFGDLENDAETRPELAFRMDAISKARNMRSLFAGFDQSDSIKDEGFQIDGFGSLMEYYRSPYVEILEFEGRICGGR